MFRLPLEEGLFPDDLETAKVIPVFMAGDENDFGNYRLISASPCFSKVLESIMRTQFTLSKAV